MMRIKKVLINLFWFGIIAFLSYRMPYITDDQLHMHSFLTGEEITSPAMIFPSVMYYYNTWGGRALSMIVIQFVLMFPRILYGITNGAVFALLANVIYAYTHAGRSDGQRVEGSDETPELFTLPVIYLFLWFFMPVMAEDMLWSTGSITYLWTNTLIMAFLLIYYRDFIGIEGTGKTVPARIAGVVGMTLLGFAAGQSNESASCATIVILFAYAVWSVRAKHRLDIDKLMGIIGCVIGCVLLLLAPGNLIRAGEVNAGAGAGSTLMTYAYRIARETFFMGILLFIPFAIGLILSLADRSWKKSMLFWIAAIVSIYVMTFSAGFANRIYQFPFILIVTAAAISVRSLLEKISDRASGDKTVMMKRLLGLFCMAFMFMALIEVTAGTLYSKQNDSFFDRHMNYYYSFEDSSAGFVPGNGMSAE